MISYTWHVLPERVTKLNEKLRANNIPTWFDKLDMNAGNVNQQMAEAVEGAETVIICANEVNYTRPNCKQEANYAHSTGKPLIFLKLEKDFKPHGWLGIIMAGYLYYDITKDNYEDELDKVVRQVKLLLEQKGLVLPDTCEGEIKPASASPQSSSSSKEIKYHFAQWTAQEVKEWLLKEELDFAVERYIITTENTKINYIKKGYFQLLFNKIKMICQTKSIY